jgi:hypothetical protein
MHILHNIYSEEVLPADYEKQNKTTQLITEVWLP